MKRVLPRCDPGSHMTLQMTTRYVADVAIVDCSGRIVLGEETASMRQYVKPLLTQSPRVVLNLAQVNYVDSSGVGTLVSLYTSARHAGGNIKLAGLVTRVKDLLQITKLGTIFEMFDAAENAAASFNELAGSSSPAEWAV
jgi:anti-sigma B factor antagonist